METTTDISNDSEASQDTSKETVDDETRGDEECVAVTPFERDSFGRTYLMGWCKSGYLERVGSFFKGPWDISYVNAADDKGRTALTIATYYEHEEIVELLLLNGAETDACTSFRGETALIMACRHDLEKSVGLLLQHGAGISPHQRELTTVANRGRNTLVKLLLAHGASCNGSDEDGKTALMEACQGGHESTVDTLLENGSEVNMLTRSKRSAAMYAVGGDHLACLKKLMAKGADLDLLDCSRQTVFARAMEQSRGVDCLRFLLGNGLLQDGGILKPVHKKGCNDICPRDDPLFTTIEFGVFEWAWCTYRYRESIQKLFSYATCMGARSSCNTNMDTQSLITCFLANDRDQIDTILKYRSYSLEDYRILSTNNEIRSLIKNKNLLEKLTHQPQSLLTWSFLVVSGCVSASGHPRQRSLRVDCLPLPAPIKRSLKFQCE